MMKTAPPAAAVVLMLLALTCSRGDARPRLQGNRCPPPGHAVLEALSLLRNVGSTFPATCHFYNNNVTLPGNISANHSQCSSALRLVHEALQGAGHVFDQHQPDLGVGGVSWDDGKLDDFQNVLYQLLEHRCFSERVSSGQLEPYFSDVTALLNKQDTCGWYVLRRDLMYILRTSLRKQYHCYSWPRL